MSAEVDAQSHALAAAARLQALRHAGVDVTLV